jgi:hypothetical protein
MMLLGLLVLAGGLFVSSGRFHSVDESAMFVAAHNLVTAGLPHTNQMGYSLWALRPGEAVNSLSPDGNLYTKKSPVMIVLLTPFIALARLGGLETGWVALWLGPLLLAGTAVLLYSLSRKLNYQRGTATIITLIFAFTTMALPYSQTIFGEMVAMFGLLLSLWSFTHIYPLPNPPPTRERELASSPLKGKGAFAFICGLGIALAIGINAVYAVVALLFGLFMLLQDWSNLRHLRNLRLIKILLWFAFPIILLGFGLLAYNQVRFGDWLTTGYNFAPGQEGFTTPLWWGMAGLLLSPARGLLWYSFPVILGLIGFPQFFKREKVLAWLMVAVIAMQVIVFSLWWEWWGGYGWGPRFLLPIVPYLMLFALPYVDTSTSLVTAVRGNRLAQAVIVIVALVGVLVQVAGVDVDANRYEQWLDANFPAPADAPLRYHHDPALVYDVGASPIVNHWQQLLAGEADNLAWLLPDAAPQLPEIATAIQSQQRPGDALIFVEPDLLYEVLAADLPPAYGLPYNVDPADELAHIVFEAAIDGVQRLWLVTWYAPGDPANWYEANLRQDWASVSDEWLGDYRLILLARTPVAEKVMPADVDFGDIHLYEYAVERLGDTLFVTFTWGADADIPADYVNFVQVFGKDSRLLTQQDRPPQAGYKPTSRWQVGEVVKDQYAFPLDAGLADVQIRVGWYAWPDLERLPVTAHDDHQVAENSLVLNP